MFDKDSVAIIAEMANAHEGDLSTAKKIVDSVSDSADGIKFQVFTADELALPAHSNYEGFKHLEMSEQEWSELIAHANKSNLLIFIDVFGEDSIRTIDTDKIDGFKIHTSDISNKPLLERVANRGLPTIVSAGGSTWLELAEAIDTLADVPLLLMYGFQNYPTELSDSNLYTIQRLREKFGIPVGYASHVDGDLKIAKEFPSLAVAAGAEAVEVHITLNRTEKGTDYYSSLEPDEFKEMVHKIREVEKTTGDRTLALSDSEIQYRENHKKWLVATGDIQKGEEFTVDNLDYKRLDNAEASKVPDIETVLGKTAAKNISVGEQISNKHIAMNVVATLACRLESTRLYGKPLQQVGDQAIISHLIDRLEKAEYIDDIVLAIADTPTKSAFIDYAEKNDIRYAIGSEEDVLRRLIDAGQKYDSNIVVRVTTENPFIYRGNLDEIIQKHINQNRDLTTTKKLPRGTAVEIISMEALEKAHKHGEDRHRSEFCSLFIVENPDLFNILAVEPPEKFKRPDLRLTVDNPSDLILAREIWEGLGGNNNGLIGLEEIIGFLDENKDAKEINSHLPDGTSDELKKVRPFMYGKK